MAEMDMLVKLYDLPDPESLLKKLEQQGIIVRRAMPYEKQDSVKWVQKIFGEEWHGWPSECDVAFANSPVSCYLATQKRNILGFACYNSTCKGFFGPEGVSNTARNKGIGTALLILSLHAMFMEGYAYAIIGSVGPVEFYKKTVNAIPIPDSIPGVYRDLLGNIKV